jgi:acyl-CoA synthetase (AMP-forming)/AMP-acid ligase II
VNRFERMPHIAKRYAIRSEEYFRSGDWTRETLGEAFTRTVASQPDQAWHFVDAAGRVSSTDLRAIGRATAEFSAALRADPATDAETVVASILPNSSAAVSAFFGVVTAGSVVLNVSMREGETPLAELLARVGARQAVVHEDDAPRRAWLDQMRERGEIDRVWLARSCGEIVADPAGGESASADPTAADREVNAEDGVHVISYTSGSTAQPKIVLYTDAQLLCEIRALRQTIHSRGALLVPSPVGHITGVLNLFLMPLQRPDPVVSMDRWDARRALDLIGEFGCSELRGTTVYFQQLLALAPDLGGLKAGMAGGGPVAPAIVRQCDEGGARLVRSYGSTEHPTVSACIEDETLEIRGGTDGRPSPGSALRLVGEDGTEVPVGTPGEIISRGPDAMAGYLEPELDAEYMTEDGWFRTGDVGVLADAGHLTISDRIKDIIIRGAENISAKEVEDRLLEWDQLVEVAVVGVPDDVYGERACAFTMSRVAPVTLEAMQGHLGSLGVEKYKWPEHVVEVDEFPRTTSGKVSKKLLKENWNAAASSA